MKTFRDILIGMLLGAIAGGGGLWLYWQYWQQMDERVETERARKEARQAHKDSLMQIRARQDAQEQESERMEARQKTVATYLERFYADVILGKERGSLPKFLSDSCKVERAAFLPVMADDGGTEAESLLRNLKVSHDHDDWYRVRLVVNGMTSYRYVKILAKGSDILIDEVI